MQGEAEIADDERWMESALAEARLAAQAGEVPVGAVVVEHVAGEPRVIGRGHNRREAERDPTAHAEIIALRAAAGQRASWRLDECTLYVTQEPCPMCAGAIVNARLARLVYGCDNPKAGAVRTLYSLVEDERLNHRAEVRGGVRAVECGALLSQFFQNLRKGQTE